MELRAELTTVSAAVLRSNGLSARSMYIAYRSANEGFYSTRNEGGHLVTEGLSGCSTDGAAIIM